MSLTIHIYYTGTNGSARKFAEEMISSGLAEQVRAEEGCQRYEYFFPLDDPETVMLYDRWINQQALDAHHQSPLMPQIAALRSKYHLRMKTEKFADWEDQ